MRSKAHKFATGSASFDDIDVDERFVRIRECVLVLAVSIINRAESETRKSWLELIVPAVALSVREDNYRGLTHEMSVVS